MTGIPLTQQRRSQLLQQLLAQQQAGAQDPNIRSGLELALKLAAQGIRQRGINQLDKQESAGQQALMEALGAGRATGPKAVTLEGVESSDQVVIPGKRADKFAQQEALAGLPPEDQMIAMQILAAQKEAQQPSPFEQKTALQRNELDAQRESQERQIAASERAQARELEFDRETLSSKLEIQREDRDFTKEQNELNRQLERELVDREIQYKKEANGVKNSGLKLTDAQGKAMTFSVRAEDSSKLLDEFAESGTGFWDRAWPILPNGWKTKERQQFEQARRNFINAVLRKESGATITDTEFDNAIEQYIPVPGDGPEVLQRKRENRETAVEGLRLESGGGYEALRERIEPPSVTVPSSDYKEGQMAVGPNGERVVFRNGEWVSAD